MEESEVLNKLGLFGLTRQEATLYLCMYRYGGLTGYEGAKYTGISRSNVYSALSGLADLKVDLTVPSLTVDMQGAILTVPMAEYGGQSDYLMAIGGNFSCDGHELPCRLILSPDIRSLNFLLRKLGVEDG